MEELLGELIMFDNVQKVKMQVTRHKSPTTTTKTTTGSSSSTAKELKTNNFFF